MARERIITGLDLGSSTIRIVVGQETETEERLQIIGAAEHPSTGISKGVISSIEDAVSSISSAVEKAERMTGQPIERVYVGVSGSHIASQESHGVVAVSRANGEINEEDVGRVIEAAQSVATPPNYEILHVIPRSFSVDNQSGIKDPIGMTGIRLEVDAQIIQGLSGQIKNITKCVYRTGLDIDDLVLGVLADAEAVLSSRQKDLGVAVLNIGGSTSSLAVFEEGDVVHTAIVPVGGSHITNDIAIGLRTSLELAEQVKVEYATSRPEGINKRDDIRLSQLDPSETATVSRKYIAEITEARVQEIIDLADKELKKIERSGLLPAGIVLTGGTAKLPGIIDSAKAGFRLPASIGKPRETLTSIDKVVDPTYSTAVGLVLWGMAEAGREWSAGRLRFNSISKVTDRVRRWLKPLIP